MPGDLRKQIPAHCRNCHLGASQLQPARRTGVQMHALRAPSKEARMSLSAPPPRSWLFVPADSNKKMMKALESDADAVIFDLEDSVAPARKPIARELLTLLPERRDGEPQRWVRINPLGTDDHREDLELLEDLEI